LLDQFQGCYKDKYRCFAAYYMICRIVIILLFIVKIFDDFTNQYLLLIACVLMGLIHLIVKPYLNTFNNVFDGAILLLNVIISVLPMVEFVDNYTFVVVITYLVKILPISSFIVIQLLLHKNEIISGIKYWANNAIKFLSKKFLHQINYNAVSTDDIEVPINEFETIIDDSVRRNVTVVPPM